MYIYSMPAMRESSSGRPGGALEQLYTATSIDDQVMPHHETWLSVLRPFVVQI